MDTLKTAIVVVLLLAVLYGVYVTLNQPDQNSVDDIAWEQQNSAEPLKVDFGQAGDSSAVTASLGDTAPWNSDPAQGNVHDHEHPMPATDQFSAKDSIGMATGTDVGSPAKPIARAVGVAAPDLISSNGNVATGAADSNQQTQEYGTATLPPAPATGDQYPEPSPTTSIYGQSQPNMVAPSGTYGEPSELSGNPQVTAVAEPPIGDSYSDAAPSPTTMETTANHVAPTTNSRIDSVVQTARGQMEQGQHYEALYSLSLAYNSPGISAEESKQLRVWLDPLAGKVIYSKEHLIGAAYQVQSGETLQSVATKHNVPWQLLANINGFRDPAAVQPGTSLKVVPGPFHAEIDVTHNSLTLFAGRLYAGTFPIVVNAGNMPAPGEYQVNDKQPGHTFYAGNAQTLGPQDPDNPFGGVWIDLGNNVSIHGTSKSPGQSARLGCVSLAGQDANDLYGILSLGSNVVIRR